MSEAEQRQKQWVVTGSEGNGEYFQHEWYIDSSDGEPVAIVNGEANVRRIVAARETAEQRDGMLEALEALARITCRCILDMPLQDCGIPVHKEVKAAIAKAKGQDEPAS